MYKLFAFDLDDTLLNDESVISARTLAALAALQRAGAKIAISTGRMVESARRYAAQIKADAPAVLYNGALIYDFAGERALSGAFVKFSEARSILSELEDMGVYAQAYPGAGYFAEKETEFTRAYAESIGVKCAFTGKRLSEWISGDQVKLLAIGDPEKMPGVMDTLSARHPEVSFMTSKPKYIEIVARGIDKGFALSKVAEAAGVSREETVAFGDGQNDLSMLKWAGKGFCMANALPRVRAECENICPSNIEDGCAIIIEEMLARGLIGK